MKKLSYLIVPLFIFGCGNSQDQVSLVQDTSNNNDQDTTTTITDTTTTITDTTTTITDTTTIADASASNVVKNKCDDCEYVTITELISNLAVIEILPKVYIEIFIDCILHILINLDKFSSK